ncbi:hypothetical protein DMW99_06495 [Pseudomonas chlororaphis]|nr:hypothetical protein C1Y36_03290 [Pseudomonas sp. FW306-2-2C-D06C]PYC40819.1 hypothetical protein DMW99_06495 [Pseudomonas chlororaphis]
MAVNDDVVRLLKRRFAAIASKLRSYGEWVVSVGARLARDESSAVRQASEVVADVDAGPVVPPVAAYRAELGSGYIPFTQPLPGIDYVAIT